MGSFFSADNLTLNGPLFLQFLQPYNFLQFLLSLRSSIFTSSKKLDGAKGYSLRVFSAVRLLFEKKIFTKGGPPFNFLIFSERMSFSFFGIVTLFFKVFFIKGSPIHQYFDTLKSFCYFGALDIAPTWAVPGCVSSNLSPGTLFNNTYTVDLIIFNATREPGELN